MLSFTIINPEVTRFIDTNAELQVLARDCAFAEGPVWSPEGFYLFSDIPANCVYRISPDGRKELYLSSSGTADPRDPLINGDQPGSNGLAFDGKGRLLLCQHGGHALARYEGGDLQPLASSFQGRPLNSPNDLIVHSDGRIYFSDPPYGLKDTKLNGEHFQLKARVYCWKEGELQVVCDTYQYPNGVCLSPDESKLYICSTKDFEKRISVYSTVNHDLEGVIAEENSDGMEIDRDGNFYLCTKEGLVVLDNKGQRMAVLTLPKHPSNCCWGGRDGRDLLITAREEVYLVQGFRRD
jgi:gluconolactonase